LFEPEVNVFELRRQLVNVFVKEKSLWIVDKVHRVIQFEAKAFNRQFGAELVGKRLKIILHVKKTGWCRRWTHLFWFGSICYFRNQLYGV